MIRRFDHIDLRVPKIDLVESFYSMLLPALGFTRRVPVDGWLQFESGEGAVTEFFGVTESFSHVPNENRIAFWASSIDEVQRIAEIARSLGARNVEGPMDYEPGYYAVFLEDPCGNRLEVCHRAINDPAGGGGK